MPNKNKTIQIIRKAFSGVHLNNGVSLREAKLIDLRASKAKKMNARRKDETTNWENISFNDIEKYKGIFCFLDAKGVLFHLPAYMIYLLENHDKKTSSDAEEDVIFSLTPNMSDMRWFKGRFQLFNHDQMLAIISFLEWKLLHDDEEYYTEEIQQALDYWQTACQR